MYTRSLFKLGIRLSLCLGLFLGLSACSKPAVESATADQIREKQAYNIAYQAYLYGFVRVKGMLLQDRAIHPKYPDYAPINQFYISKELAKPGFTDFTPNHDTLYGLAWLDLSQGPILMTVPEVPNRYYTIQATDVSLNTFNYIGSRVKSKAGTYAYAHQDWQGQLPAGVQRIDSPSNQVFLQLRPLVFPNIEGDIEHVYKKMTQELALRPLHASTNYPVIDASSTMANPKNTNPDLHSPAFFKLLNRALNINPAFKNEAALLAQFKRLNIGAGLEFEMDKLSISEQAGIQRGINDAIARLVERRRLLGERLGGWSFSFVLGDYGFDYVTASMVAFFGYGANTAQEALYTTALIDSQGKKLNGEQQYKITFAKDNMPPVDAFWSITMYQRPDNQLVENPINRYNFSERTKDITYNEDGSLDIWVQHKQPSDNRNWLPAPKGSFWMILRMYNPKEIVLNALYQPPLIVRQ